MFSNITPSKHTKTIDEYTEDYPTFLLSDLKTIKESILDNTKYTMKITGTDNKKPIKNKIATKKSLPSDWSDINELVFGIRDNEQLLNTLSTYKKQKVGLGYVYIESLQYISILIKKPQKYPLIVIRIPVEPPFVAVSDKYVGLLFKFPIESIYNKESSSKSKNRQYRLYLDKEDNDFVMYLETIVNNDIKKSQIKNIDKYDNDMINMLLKSQMAKYLNVFQLNKTNDISCTINEMNITVVKKLPSNQAPITFDILQNKQTAYLEFHDDKLDFIIRGENKNDEQTILTKADSNYWPQIDYNNTSYVIHEYDQMFKLAHYSIKSTKDGIYYLLTSFLNAHMFIILITDQDVLINEEVKIYNFQDLFNKGTQVLEMYLLIENKDD